MNHHPTACPACDAKGDLAAGVFKADLLAVRSRQSRSVVGQHFAVTDAQGLDPALLAEGQGDEKPEFDQFRNAKVLVQLLPKRVVSDVGVPDDRAGVGQRDFFALGKFV